MTGTRTTATATENRSCSPLTTTVTVRHAWHLARGTADAGLTFIWLARHLTPGTADTGLVALWYAWHLTPGTADTRPALTTNQTDTTIYAATLWHVANCVIYPRHLAADVGAPRHLAADVRDLVRAGS